MLLLLECTFSAQVPQSGFGPHHLGVLIKLFKMRAFVNKNIFDMYHTPAVNSHMQEYTEPS